MFHIPAHKQPPRKPELTLGDYIERKQEEIKVISEVDVRDWNKIDIPTAREVINNLDDYARMNAGINPVGSIKFMNNFLDDLEELKKKQTRHIPKLERKD